MKRTISLLLCTSTLSLASMLAYAQAPDDAQQPPAAIYDMQQLPSYHGKIQQFTLTPRGDIDGFIFTDNTEVKTPPHLSTQIAAAFKAGDSVTVHGLKAVALPLIKAASVTNDASTATVTDNGPPMGGPGKPPPPPRREHAGSLSTINGKVKQPLYGVMGEINGILLTDGTVVTFPPPAAQRLGNLLTAGNAIYVRGEATSTVVGKVVDARAIGASADALTQLPEPPPPPHGGPRPGDAPPPPPAGPDGAPPPPPPGE